MAKPSLKLYNPDVVAWVRSHMEEVRTDSSRAACIVKTEFYSSTTYLRDIEGSITRILALLDAENKP